MKLYKKFSNLFDVNIIKQLSNKDILISSSNQIKIYSINTFEKIYNFKEINSPIISIQNIIELDYSKIHGILLAISLSDNKIQIIKLFIKNKDNIKYNKKVLYKHKLIQDIIFKINSKIINLHINSLLNTIIIGINDIIFYYQSKEKEKIIFKKIEEYKIKSYKNQKNSEIIIRGIKSLKTEQDNFIITIEEVLNKGFDLKIYYFENLELITHLEDLNIYPEKGQMSFMSYYDKDKIYLIVGDGHDNIMILKLFDDFDIYENICLTRLIKELFVNKYNKSSNYELKSLCGLNNGIFVVCLYYNEPLNEKNYIIRCKINFTNRKFELLEINDNAHNNKTNFITFSALIKNNRKIEEYFFMSGDHEGMLKLWKI